MQTLKSSIDIYKEPLNELKQSIEGLSTGLHQSSNSEDDEEKMIKRQALKAKRTMNSTWKKTLNQRKQRRYQHMRNENIIDIYLEWISSESFIPKKFRPRAIPNELESETNIRLKAARQNMMTEVELCKVRAVNNLQQLQELDSMMIAEIMEKYDGAVAERLKELYRQESEECDKIAIADALKQKTWLQELPSSEKAEENDKNALQSAKGGNSNKWETVTRKKKPNYDTGVKPQRHQKTLSVSIQVQCHKQGRKVSVIEPTNWTDQAYSNQNQSKQRGNIRIQTNDVRDRGAFLGKGRKLRGKLA